MIRINAHGFLPPPSAGVCEAEEEETGVDDVGGVLASGADSGAMGGVASGAGRMFGGTLGGAEGGGSGTFATLGCDGLKPILLDRSFARFARLRNSSAR